MDAVQKPVSRIYFTSLKVGNYDKFANIIFNNFSYLEKFPELSHSVDEIKKQLGAKNAMNFMIYDENKVIIGYVIGDVKVLQDGRRVYYISYFYIKSSYRSKGIGKMALGLVKDRCVKNRISWILLTCDSKDEKVYGFYVRNGFSVDKLFGGGKSRHHVLSVDIGVKN